MPNYKGKKYAYTKEGMRQMQKDMRDEGMNSANKGTEDPFNSWLRKKNQKLGMRWTTTDSLSRG